MTINELIAKLQALEDKTLPVTAIIVRKHKDGETTLSVFNTEAGCFHQEKVDKK